MRLVEFRVRKFRNILDSETIRVQPDVTCLVGKNESGKTAILSALYRLNPAYSESFSISEHYPRWLRKKDEREKVVEKTETIQGVFDLDASDLDTVVGLLGEGVLVGEQFSYTRGYDTKTWANVDVDNVRCVANLLDEFDFDRSIRERLAGHADIQELRSAAEAIRSDVEADSSDSASLVALEQAIAKRFGTLSIWQTIVNLLKSRMPKFFYFSDYSRLDGRIDLTDLQGAGTDGPAKSSLQTARALLALAQTTVDSLSDDDYEDRTSELEAVSNELTDQVFEFWSQNEQLEVKIDIDKETIPAPGQRGQQAVARYLDLRVRDRRHGYTSNFDQRSAGFRWFFSFLAAFSEFEDKGDVVVLLDEPGLALHAKAQADFLRFINERLATGLQVIYTTHSPFMVESGRLERARVVEDKGPKIGAVVSSDVFSVDNDTIFPLQAALGYDIAQNLFIGPCNLLVEGTSDFTYLTVMSDHLASLGRAALDPRLRVLPVGSISNIPTFVALIGRNLDVTVLVDSTPGNGMQKLQELVAKGVLKSKRLLTVGMVAETKDADIEDLFSVKDYLRLYNGQFNRRLTESKLVQGGRIIDRIGRTMSAPFTDHGLPADFLLRHRLQQLDKMEAETLDSFESLIVKINATLPPAT